MIKKWSRNAEGKKPPVSIVMAVYNKPRELKICLEGYRRQSALEANPRAFELMLADDGSGPEIERIFLQFADEVEFPCTHLWQEDKGWGKLRMLNIATLEALSERLVFTDGDCVPQVHFARAHIEAANGGSGACGRRVDIMERLTPSVTEAAVREGALDSPFWVLRHSLARDLDYGGQGFYLSESAAGLVNLFSTNHEPTVLGSNFGVHRKWLLMVNGFDESFGAPGLGEDTDLERRLKLAGLKLEWATYRAVQFHLWHPLTRVGDQSRKIMEERLSRGNLEAVRGLRELKNSL